MIDLGKRSWFIKTITWLNEHWDWFRIYIYGHAENMEDFVRNPGDVLKHTTFPFCIRNVKFKSVLNMRFGFIPFKEGMVNDYIMEAQAETGLDVPSRGYHEVSLGENKFIVEGKKWRLIDIRVWNDFITKYCNSLLFFQFVGSLKYNYIPIPFIALCIRLKKNWYFQFGLGWPPSKARDEYGNKIPDSSLYNACFTSKILFVRFEKEIEWNGSDVFGFYEGTI
jgi:hypothetical protein